VHVARGARREKHDRAGHIVRLAPAPGRDTVDDLTIPRRIGAETLSLTPAAAVPVVFVNVAVTSCVERPVNVVTRDRLTRCTSYRAATTLAWIASVVASLGYPVVITPS